MEAVLFALPLLAMLALLVRGHFLGEERILEARSRRLAAPRRRRPARRWARDRRVPLVSLLDRAPRSLRGPPRSLVIV
ncbi:hypothetical protein [Solirubrobacter soli]|uniref:hypothetical protein n=1 Tax=Solirubrobacter soli TaxID=363832 RepID=UPI0004045E54|nr:hypothetical protein [Solirubrobacter soli]